MGFSTRKQTTKTNQTTTPVVAPFMSAPIEAFTGKVSDFLGTDPSQYVAGPSALQTQVFDQAANLGAGQSTLNDAIAAAKASGATTTAPVTAATAGTSNALSALANAPRLGPAAQAGGVTVAGTPGARAFDANASSILSNGGVQRYMDPAIQAYVDATLASYDRDAAQRRAQLEAQGAGQRAFGGSRWGFAEGEFDSQAALDRATLDAQLRAQAYAQALGAAGEDANRAQQVSVFNAGNRTGVSQNNASLAAQRALAQAGFNQNTAFANQNATNQFGLTQAQMDAAMAEANAARQQQTSMFNAGNAQQTALANAAAQNQASQFNASQAAADANRALAAAGLVGNLGETQAQTELADTSLAAQIGAQQQALAQAQASAVPTQLQIGGQLYSFIPPPSYIGENLTGVTKTTASPGIGNVLAGALGNGLAAYAMGGGFPKFGA